jgi:hypothetical protein
VPATETLNVTDVPVLPDGLLKVTPGAATVEEVPSKAAAVEYWLKPVPVNVTVVEDAPGLIGVVALVAVMVGATVLGPAIPRPPVRMKDAPLPPFVGEGFTTVTLQSCVAVPDSGTTAVIDEALTTEDVARAVVKPPLASLQPLRET